MKLLITGGKSAAWLKLLRHFKDDEVFIADYGDVPVFPSKAYRFISLGPENRDTTAHSLLAFCLDHEFDGIVPVYGFEIDALASSCRLFEEYGIRVLLPAEFEPGKS